MGDRLSALMKLRSCLAEYNISGLSTSTLCEAVLASILAENTAPIPALDTTSPFNSLTGARFNHYLYRTVVLTHAGVTHSVGVTSQGAGHFSFTIGDKKYSVSGKLSTNTDMNYTELVTDIDGSISKQRVLVTGDNLALYTKQGSYEFSKPTPKYKLAGGGGGSLGDAVAP